MSLSGYNIIEITTLDIVTPNGVIIGGEDDLAIELSSDVIRGYSDLMILSIILDEPSYGYEISKRIRTLTDEKFIMKETTLYSAFKRLEKNGYIYSFKGDKTQGKTRTYYKITGLGLSYYVEKCLEWELTKQIVEKFIRRK